MAPSSKLLLQCWEEASRLALHGVPGRKPPYLCHMHLAGDLPRLCPEVRERGTELCRNPLIYMFSTIRLMATMEAALNNNRLESIDALLGCPVALFPMVRVVGHHRILVLRCTCCACLNAMACSVGGLHTAVQPRVPHCRPAGNTNMSLCIHPVSLSSQWCIAACLSLRLDVCLQDLASPAQFGKQPSEVQRVVLLGVFYALNWYRELVNAFAAQLDLPG
jgi:hypothetical protein